MILVLQVGMAAWMAYLAIRAVTSVHPWIQTPLVAGICYGLLFVPPVVLTVLDAAAVAAIVRALLSIVTPQPAPADTPRMKRPKRPRQTTPGAMPDLP